MRGEDRKNNDAGREGSEESLSDAHARASSLVKVAWAWDLDHE